MLKKHGASLNEKTQSKLDIYINCQTSKINFKNDRKKLERKNKNLI